MLDAYQEDYYQQAVWRSLAEIGEAAEPCPHCYGMGWVSLSLPVEHPAFGHAFRCLCQREKYQAQIVERMLAEAGQSVPDDASRYTLLDFPAYAELAQAVMDGEAIDDGGRSKPGLLLSGTVGTGKTTLASLIFQGRIARGDMVAWIDYTRFIKRVQATYSEDYQGPSAENIINSVQRADLLVIDDMGATHLTGTTSDDRIEIMFQVLHAREMHNMATVITTNLSRDGLYTQFGDRIASRIRGMCVAVIMQGVDYRTGERMRVR